MFSLKLWIRTYEIEFFRLPFHLWIEVQKPQREAEEFVPDWEAEKQLKSQ